MCRWDTPQNFCFAFIDDLEKQLFIKKLLKLANKNVRILIFTILDLKKKTPGDIIILHLCPKHLDNMI